MMMSSYEIAPDDSTRSTRSARPSESMLRLTQRPSSRRFIVMGLFLFGFILLAGYFYPDVFHINRSLRKSLWVYHGIGALGALFSLCALNVLLDKPEIHVDAQRQEVRFQTRWWGVLDKSRRIPFRDIEQIRMEHHPRTVDTAEYWSILLKMKNSSFLKTIDQGSEPTKDYLDEVLALMEKLIGLKAEHRSWGGRENDKGDRNPS